MCYEYSAHELIEFKYFANLASMSYLYVLFSYRIEGGKLIILWKAKNVKHRQILEKYQMLAYNFEKLYVNFNQ